MLIDIQPPTHPIDYPGTLLRDKLNPNSGPSQADMIRVSANKEAAAQSTNKQAPPRETGAIVLLRQLENQLRPRRQECNRVEFLTN